MNTTSLSIEFDEGETWPIVFVFPNGFDLTPYSASIEVRRDVGTPIIMEFSTANGTIQKEGGNLMATILPAQSIGRAGQYRYQLKLMASAEDVIKFPVEILTIKRALNP